MSVLSAQTIRRLKLVRPLRERFVDANGNSGGLSCASYDLTLSDKVLLRPGDFVLSSTAERFVMPNSVIGIIHDKSSLARRGVVVQNTVAEPGWKGFLTLELTNHSKEHTFFFPVGSAIAQVVFHFLDEPTEKPYDGKYQNQGIEPTEAIAEKAT